MSSTTVGQSNGLEPAVTPDRFSKQNVITYLIMLAGLALLAYGLVNLNNWRLVSPKVVAEARVAKEEGLTTAERASLYELQFKVATDAKGQFGRQGLIFAVLGIATIWVSRRWQEWRRLFGEQMLYAYAFLLPPVGWILYLGAYPTRGDHNRMVIRRNIGIMSLAVISGLAGYYLILLLQANVISPLGNSVAGSNVAVGVFNFLLVPQIAYFAGIIVGAYVAFRTRDVRAIAVAAQLVVLAVVLVIFGWLGSNASAGIEARGLSATDFGFVNLTSGFDVSESLIDYDRNSTYGRAFFVGALNTLLVSLVGIALATVLGLFVGIARLSTNWLTSTIARAFVELMRNIPLLVLMFFLYAGVLLQLPRREETAKWLGSRILLNNRGVALTWPKPTETFLAWLPYLIAAIIIGAVVWYFRNRTLASTGRPAFSFWGVALGFGLVAVVGGVITKPFALQVPFIDGLNYAKDQNRNFIGLVMSPEFFGVLLALVLYTGAYIGEVVRAGIQAVSKGQREAATALGLSNSQSLQLIILPQALQVIIPPLTNQYLNLAKNSSLAIAIGYADLFAIATTTFNQSGQSVQVVLMIMASYLSLSLTISVVMNFINRQIQIKER
ncbi:MAG: amino acid ABC transporter permease [Anaerolineae bacterium]